MRFVFVVLLSLLFACSEGIEDSNTENPNLGSRTYSRVNDNIVLLYQFNEGSGSVINDNSGYQSPQDLNIDNPDAVTWINGGLRVNGAALIHSNSANDKLRTAIEASQSLTVEAWVKPLSSSGGYASLFAQAGDTTTHNFMLNQQNDIFGAKLRTLDTNARGEPELVTNAGYATTDLAHVMMTWNRNDQTLSLYVNGDFVNSISRTGKLVWESLELRVAYELGSDGFSTHEWLGELFLLAVYQRALSAAEVKQNYLAGPEA